MMSVRVNRSFAPCARLNLYHSIRTLSAISIDDRRRVRWSCITTFGLLLELLQINPCCKEQSLLLFDVWIPRVELYTSASRHLVSAYTLPSFPASSRGIRTSNNWSFEPDHSGGNVETWRRHDQSEGGDQRALISGDHCWDRAERGGRVGAVLTSATRRYREGALLERHPGRQCRTPAEWAEVKLVSCCVARTNHS